REGLIRDEARTRTVRAFPPCVAPSQGGPLGVAEIVPTGVTPVIRPSAARPLAPAARVHGRRQATRRPGGRWGASRTAAANFGREIALRQLKRLCRGGLAVRPRESARAGAGSRRRCPRRRGRARGGSRR